MSPHRFSCAACARTLWSLEAQEAVGRVLRTSPEAPRALARVEVTIVHCSRNLREPHGAVLHAYINSCEGKPWFVPNPKSGRDPKMPCLAPKHPYHHSAAALKAQGFEAAASATRVDMYGNSRRSANRWLTEKPAESLLLKDPETLLGLLN